VAQSGAPSRRQQLIAAWLYLGPDGAIDGADACWFHGIKAVSVDASIVRTVVPATSAARSRGFVVVRRTDFELVAVTSQFLRYVEPATAVIAATRDMTSYRSVLAALSDVLQRRVTTYEDLVLAHAKGAPRNRRLATEALESLAAGTRSVPEADFRQLVARSRVLPTVEYNVWLRLSTGRVVCVDALIESSALVHETNGRVAHAREDLFVDMQERHDALTAEGLTVLHNPPVRLRRQGAQVLEQVERCHLRAAGRGLPPGVIRLASAA
jgi:hypothetical protein